VQIFIWGGNFDLLVSRAYGEHISLILIILLYSASIVSFEVRARTV
jgi:hypothetical protein